MKLTTELVYDRLCAYYDVRYTVANNKSTLAGRPVFYQPGMTPGDRICILTPDTADDLPPESGVFVSIGEVPWDPSAQGAFELLTVPAEVPLTALFNSLQDIFDYYDACENELNAIIENDRGYQEMIRCATQYLDCPISLVDEDFTIIAISEQNSVDFRDTVDQDKISTSIMSDLVSDPSFSKGLHNNDVFEFNLGGEIFLAFNYKKEGKYLGRLSLHFQNKTSKDAYIYLVRFLAQKIDVMLRKIGSFLIHRETYSSLREIITKCLNNTPMERQHTEYRLNENGWSYTDEYMLIRLQPEFRHEWQLHATYLIPTTERLWPGSCAVEYDRYVLILLNRDVFAAKSDKNVMQELAYFLRDGLMLAGISRSFHGLDHLPAFYKQTELAISLGRDKDPMCWYYCFDDYALQCWINYGTMNFTQEQLCSKVLLDLLAYDKANNTEYYKTLRTFCNRKFSYTHAADDLYIHRTTLIKRIERIIELTDVDLENPDQNLYIALSFRYLDKRSDPSTDDKRSLPDRPKD